MTVDSSTRTIILNEYKILWEYYNTTLSERKNIYNWYFKIIALPATIVSVLFKSNYVKLPSEDLTFFLLGFYSIIFLAGISLFITYTLESAASAKYYNDINKMRRLLRDIVGKPNRQFIYVDPNYKQRAKIFSIRFFKSFTVPIINSGIGLNVLNNIHTWNIELNILFYLIMLWVHAFLYKKLFNIYSERNTLI